MNYSDSALNKGKPAWLLQTVADLARMEGFREFAYPDPLSKLGRRYASPKFGWGFSPGDALLVKYGEHASDGVPWTIGFGETKNVTPASRQSKEFSMRQLEDNVINVRVPIANRLTPTWLAMPLFAQTVILNLAYNLGEQRLSKFTGTLASLNHSNWSAAADGLRNSLWFKQVGDRGRELVARLADQQIDPKYKIV